MQCSLHDLFDDLPFALIKNFEGHPSANGGHKVRINWIHIDPQTIFFDYEILSKLDDA